MKTITINVSEPVYRTFQEYVKTQNRSTSELIREAMEFYEAERISEKTSLRNRTPVSVGKVLKPMKGRTNLEMGLFDENRS